MIIHLIDTNNDKTYCGLKGLITITAIEDFCIHSHKIYNCGNCKKVVEAIKNKYSKGG